MNANSMSEKAALYALGLLTPDEAAEVEARIAQDPSLAAEVRDYSETSAALAFASAAEPPAALRDRVLNKALSGAEHGMIIVRATEGTWVSTAFEGVTVKLLLKDPASGNLTWLMKMAPGAIYPTHRHGACEQCLVLEGEVCIDEQRFVAGDFEAAPSGTRHGVVSSPNGCLLLIIASPHDELFV